MLVSLSVFLHTFFVWNQGFTNDEGAYLYDARTILGGELPAGDVLTKAPVPIVFFAIGEIITGKSLFAARIVNGVVSILTVIPLFFLLRALHSENAARIGALFWLLGSGAIVFHTMGHTQAIANFFAVSSLCLFVLGVRLDSGITKFFLAGVCFALAYASRKTAVAVLVPIILSWIIFRYSRKESIKVMQIFLLGVMSICIPWLCIIYILYDVPGIWHMFGGVYGNIVVHAQSIEAWAGSAEHMVQEAARIGFFYGLLLVAVCIAIMRDRVLVGAGWIASLTVLYWLWPTHLVEYLADFIPSVVIAGSVAIVSFRLKQWQMYGVIGIFMCTTIASLSSVYIKPWTGMFTREAVWQSAQWLTENVSLQEEIFTAAVIVPYVSGHRVPFHLSHPQWYRYSFITEQDKNTFLPPYDQVQQTVQNNISWILRDQLTRYVYPDMSLKAFQKVYSIPNTTKFRQNLLRVYLRQ